MAKKTADAFAMSDEDEFIDTGEEGGEDGSGNSDGTESEGQSGAGADGASGDGSEGSGDQGGDEGSGEDGSEGDSGGDGSGEGDEGGSGADEGSEDGEGEGEEGDESASGKKGSGSEESDGSDKGEGEQDFFGDLSGESSEESGQESTALSFKDIGNALDISLENDTQEEFTEKVRSKIEGAKQQVDLTGFDPEARRLVDHLNKNGGKLGDFFKNPTIASLQNVLSMTEEDKVRAIRRTELSDKGGTQEEIDNQINEELGSMTASQIMQTASKLDQDANNLIATEINKIVGESEENVRNQQTQEAEKVKKSREDLRNYVQEQDDFLGIELSTKAKSAITKDIETGRLDEVVDLTDAEVRFAAYMIKRSGGKIKDTFVKQLAERSREGYNKATDKHTNRLHKNKEDAGGSGSGHQESSEGKKNYENWGDLDI